MERREVLELACPRGFIVADNTEARAKKMGRDRSRDRKRYDSPSSDSSEERRRRRKERRRRERRERDDSVPPTAAPLSCPAALPLRAALRRRGAAELHSSSESPLRAAQNSARCAPPRCTPPRCR